MKTELITDKYLSGAAKAIKKGFVVAFPTETVYGLGIIYDNLDAFNTLNTIKRRPPNQPYSLMLGSIHDIEKYAIVNVDARKLIEAFLPGDLTIILKAKDNLPQWCVNSKDGSVGIRVPDYQIVTKLINLVGKPLLVPSANRHDSPPLLRGVEVFNEFNGEIPFVVDGTSGSMLPSTIVTLCDKCKILRIGNITKDKIENVLRKEID